MDSLFFFLEMGVMYVSSSSSLPPGEDRMRGTSRS